MNMKEKKRVLALYRLQQASESLDEAQYLFTGSNQAFTVDPGFPMNQNPASNSQLTVSSVKYQI